MPASANTDGKIVFCFKNADKFIARYSTLAFEDVSPLDGAGMWLSCGRCRMRSKGGARRRGRMSPNR